MAKPHTLTSHALALLSLLFNGALMAARPPVTDLTQDGVKGQMASGSVFGKVATFTLIAASTAQKLTYLDSTSWRQKNLFPGENGLATPTCLRRSDSVQQVIPVIP
jgi:hypothetical protein